MKRNIVISLISVVISLTGYATEEHTWQICGEGVLKDAVLPAFFKVESYEMTVDIYEDVDNPGYYRVVAPYGKSNPYYSNMTDYLENEGLDGELVFDARDASNVILEQSKTGLVYEKESVTVNSYTWWEANGMYPELLYDTRRGTLRNGIIRFSATPPSLWITTASLDAMDMGFTPSVEMELRLPGASDYSLDIALASWCLTDDGRAIVASWPGTDIAKVEAAVTAAEDAEEQIAYVKAHPTELPYQTGAYLDVPEGVGAAQRLNIVALGYDADNQLQTVVVEHVYTPDTDDGWVAMEGLAGVSDFLGNPSKMMRCAVEESEVTPGLIRLVNPMAESTAGMGHVSGYSGHNDYIYMDIADEKCVILGESPLGITLQDYGDMRIRSDALDDIAEGKDKQWIGGSLRAGIMVNGVISFPDTAIIRVGAMTQGSDTWMRLDSSDLNIDLSGVNGLFSPIIDSDEVPEVYYDTYGRRVFEPQPGTIVVGRGRKVVIIE